MNRNTSELRDPQSLPTGTGSSEYASQEMHCPASPAEEALARELLTEYALELLRNGGTQPCGLRQTFRQELETFPGEYAPPGAFLLAFVADQCAGCVALRRSEPLDTCEMKRLYVRPAFRDRGVGRMLVSGLVDQARALGYRRMILDTLPVMREAVALYRSLGFTDIPPYGRNQVPGAIYLERLIHAKEGNS